MSQTVERPPGLRSRDRLAINIKFRARLAEGAEPLVLPGVATALTAVQAEQSGFEACYLTGAGFANLEYALPDIGLLGLGEVSEQVRRIAGATTLPIVVDADTGFGGPLAVVRAVRELERSGATAIQIEDQESPKRCGHFDGKRLESIDEMEAKIRAAVYARTDETVIIARTDAIAVDGLESAIRRALAFRQAGADVLFVEAPRDIAELTSVAEALAPHPLMVNIVEGGVTPEMSAASLWKLGYSVVLFANAVTRVMARAAEDALRVLATDGSTDALRGRMQTWRARQDLVGLAAADMLEDELRGYGEAGLRKAHNA